MEFGDKIMNRTQKGIITPTELQFDCCGSGVNKKFRGVTISHP
jgi:hypothetical protein